MANPEDAAPTYTDQMFRLLRAGDEESRSLLVRRLAPWLRTKAQAHHRLCWRRVCGDVQDTANEVWSRFFQPGTLARFRHEGAGSLRRFLAGILRNVILSKHSRARREFRTVDASEWSSSRAEADSAADESVTEDASPSQWAIAKDLSERMNESLSVKERLVFQCLVEQGFGPKELADAFGWSESGARGRIFRLRKVLAAWWPHRERTETGDRRERASESSDEQ